jgi:hypothetical protein
MLAAPVLASMVLISRYFIRKLLDQDPWPPSESESSESNIPWTEFINRLLKGKQKSDTAD